MMAKKRVEELMRLKSSILEERGGAEQAGTEDSPEEHASPEVLIEPALDRQSSLSNPTHTILTQLSRQSSLTLRTGL
jgi:hypothetical protein